MTDQTYSAYGPPQTGSAAAPPAYGTQGYSAAAQQPYTGYQQQGAAPTYPTSAAPYQPPTYGGAAPTGTPTSYGQTGSYQPPGYGQQPPTYSNNGSSYPTTTANYPSTAAPQTTYQQASPTSTYGTTPAPSYPAGGYPTSGNPPPTTAPAGYSQPDGGQAGYKPQPFQSGGGAHPPYGAQPENPDRRGGGGGGGYGGGFQSNPGGYGGGNGGGGYRGGDDRYGGGYGDKGGGRGGNRSDRSGGNSGNYGSGGSPMDAPADGKEYQDDTVFISNIPTHVTEDQIGDMFGSIGIIKIDKKTQGKKIWLYRNPQGESKGEATVTYDDPPTARAAIEWFNAKDFMGNPIKVELAEKFVPKNLRGPRGGMGGGRGRGGPPRGGRGGGGGFRGGRGGGGAGGDDKSRTGDWDCPSCGNMNFARRTSCNRCNTARSGDGGGGDFGGPPQPLMGGFRGRGGGGRGGPRGGRGGPRGGGGGYGGGRDGAPDRRRDRRDVPY